MRVVRSLKWLAGILLLAVLLHTSITFGRQVDSTVAAAPPAAVTYDVFQLDPGRTPASNMLCAGDGAVFFGEEHKDLSPGYLGRIDASGNLTEWAYGSAPISMVHGGANILWTADFEGVDIARLDTSTNQLRRWDTGYTHLHGIGERAGVIWTASREGFILKLEPAADRLTVYQLPGGGPLKHSLLDSRGWLWIAGGDLPGNGAALFRLDTATLTFTRYDLPANFNPWAIREAADGSMWLSDFNGNRNRMGNAVGRLQPGANLWTTYSHYPNLNYGTALAASGGDWWGVNIWGDEFFHLDPARASSSSMTLNPTSQAAIVVEQKQVAPVTITLNPVQRRLTPSRLATTGVAHDGYTVYPLPSPGRLHNLFGLQVCGDHVWMTGLYVDQLYHFTLTAPPAPPTATATPTSAAPAPTATATPASPATATATPTPPSAADLGPNLLANATFAFVPGSAGVTGHQAEGGYSIVVSGADANACWHADLPAVPLRGATVRLQADMRKTANMGAHAPYLSLQALFSDGSWQYNYGGVAASPAGPSASYTTSFRDIAIGQDVVALRASLCVWKARAGQVFGRSLALRRFEAAGNLTPTATPSRTPTLASPATPTPTATSPAAVDLGPNLLGGAAFAFAPGSAGVVGRLAEGGYSIEVSGPNAIGCWHTDVAAAGLRGSTVRLQAEMRKTANMGAHAPYVSLQALKTNGNWQYNYGGIITSPGGPGAAYATSFGDIAIGHDVVTLRAAFCVWKASAGQVLGRNLSLRVVR